jgi:hypothetical protein
MFYSVKTREAPPPLPCIIFMIMMGDVGVIIDTDAGRGRRWR